MLIWSGSSIELKLSTAPVSCGLMRATIRPGRAAIILLLPLCFAGLADPSDNNLPVETSGRTPQAPPRPPPIEVREPGDTRPGPRPQGAGDTLYSIGNPTDEEQLHLEYINRARANAPAEAARLRNTTDPDVLSAYSFFAVDLDLMESQFATIAPAPPLAMNAQLTVAARRHSGDMYTNQFQGHTGTDGSSLGSRATAAGYSFVTLGENVFSYAESVFHGHAGFEVDWGAGPGGMQTPPGHRNSIHNAGFREVGIGVIVGSNGSVGPQLVTEDFGTRQSATPLVTGVVYYDFNGNSFYDLGEGIGGVTVEVEPSTYYAVTANSGGYAVPVSGNGPYTVMFVAPGLATNQQSAVVTGAQNVKVDYLPVYSPPVVSGPDPAAINLDNTYTFTPVGGASSYDWEQTGVSPLTAVEGADNGLTGFTATTSSGYNVVVGNPNGSGNVFHLAHPSPVSDQILVLNRLLLPAAGSQMQFRSRLGVASATQVARVQVSADSGTTWTDVFSQAGNGQPGETSFSTRTASLAAFAGTPLTVRFVYEFTGGSFFPQTSTTPTLAGWAFDDISFSNTEALTAAATSPIPAGTSFVFNPGSIGDYLLRVRAVIGTRTIDWGPSKRVTAANVVIAPVVSVATPVVSGNQLWIEFDVANYTPNLPLQLLTAADAAGAWNADSTATLQTVTPNSRFRFVTTPGAGPVHFYRVRAN